MSDRSEFEKSISSRFPGMDLSFGADGEYADLDACQHWETWQASRAQGGQSAEVMTLGRASRNGVRFEGRETYCQGWNDCMSAHPQPAQQGVPEGRIFSDSDDAREFLVSACKHEYSRYIRDRQHLAGDFACHIASLLATTPQPAPSVPDEALAALNAVKMRIEDCYVAMAPSAEVAVSMVLDAIRLEKESRTPMFTSDTPQPAVGWTKCAERLPSLTGWYCVALTDPNDIGWSTSVSWAAFWNGDDFEECDPVEDGQPVTHWTPFPQPPQEGEGDE